MLSTADLLNCSHTNEKYLIVSLSLTGKCITASLGRRTTALLGTRTTALLGSRTTLILNILVIFQYS